MAEARPIAPGRLVLVWYGGGEAYWHERLLLCRVEGTTWVITTPDGDVYPEDIYELNCKPCFQGSIPPSIPANALLYRFAPFGQLHTPAEWRQVFEDGIATEMERANRGVDDAAADAESGAVRDRAALHGWTADTGLPGGPPAAVAGAGDGAAVPIAAGPPGSGGPPPLPPAAAPLAGALAGAGGGAAVPLAGAPLGAAALPGAAAAAHRQWIVVANDGQPGAPAVGADWSVDASAVIMGNFALVKLGTATLVLESIDAGSKQLKLVARRGELEQAVAVPSGDGAGPQAGAAAASAGAQLKATDARMGKRFRSFVDAVGLLEEPRFADFPIQGPRTTFWLCRFIRDQGQVPRTRTDKWMRDAHVPDNDRVKHEHGSLMEILEYALTYDQLDVSSLASFEILARRVQLLEEAYTSNPKAPRFEGGQHFQGLGRRVAAAAPMRTSHVAGQLQGEAQIQKERRKAREEGRQLVEVVFGGFGAYFNAVGVVIEDLGEMLFEAWRMVASATCCRCRGWARLKSHVALSVAGFSSAFVVARGLTGASTRQFGLSASLGALAAHRSVAQVESRRALLLLWPEMPRRPRPCLESGPLRMKPSRRFCAQTLAAETATALGVDIYQVLPSDASHKFKRLRDAILLSDEEYALRIMSEGLPNLYFDPVLEAIYSASFDIKDYFQELRIDEELSQYFALPAVRASAVGVGSISGVQVDTHELIYPALQSLPMGFSWAMWAAQLVHEEVLRRAGLPPPRLLRDGTPPPSLGGGPVHMAFADNFGAIGCDMAEKAGFHVHEIERVSTSLDIIGVHLDGERKVVTLSAARAWRIYAGLHAFVRRGRCTGREMRAILGHLCFAFLLRRPCLSCIAAAFAFAESAGNDCENIWPSVKRGLLIAAAILPLVYADISAGWLHQVVATDASTTGLGVCVAEWPTHAIQLAGPHDERWRFKKDPQRKHREVALAGYDVAEPPVDRDDNLTVDSDESAWLAVGDFLDVEPAAVKEARWAVVAKRPCGSHMGAIHVKEARGAMLGLKHVVRRGRWRHRKVLTLADNMGLLLALQSILQIDLRGSGSQQWLMLGLHGVLPLGLFILVPGVVTRAPGAIRRRPAGVTARSVAQRIETAPAMHLVSLETRVRGQQPLVDAGRLAEIAGHSFDKAGCRAPICQQRRPLLESIAVRPVQVEDYHRRIEEFYGFVRRQGLSTCTLDSLETALLDWADDAFLEGRKKHDGEKMKAAVLHHYPNFERPNTKPLARFERCLKAWGRRRPALGRLPPPCPTICGLAVGLHLLDHTDMAVAALVALSAYLRPGELRGLRVRDVVPPALGYGPECQKWSLILGPTDGQGDPTKMGVHDDSVTMDHENLQFLGHFFELHRRGKAPDEPLWSFTQAELGAMIAKALKVCNLEGLGIVPYSLRHAGPSWDVITGRRSQRGVQRRGRWASISSLIRYEKSSKVNSMLVNLDDSRGDIFLDIFAGSEGVGKAAARCGISSLEVEMQSGLDLLAPGVMEAPAEAGELRPCEGSVPGDAVPICQHCKKSASCFGYAQCCPFS
ncbi:unnamed protein product [Prorocentrum cordatum]|uniref:Uncharacterized protein n=1 Tax=Prorocentrum cordatum TaxID=2364126 RepID=A0ABN9U4M0_9DINO|nr:unnamed protein product [Polarella glacialis]